MQPDISKWERDNFYHITGWVADWEIKKGYKVITFSLLDGSKKVFELPIPNTTQTS